MRRASRIRATNLSISTDHSRAVAHLVGVIPEAQIKSRPALAAAPHPAGVRGRAPLLGHRQRSQLAGSPRLGRSKGVRCEFRWIAVQPVGKCVPPAGVGRRVRGPRRISCRAPKTRAKCSTSTEPGPDRRRLFLTTDPPPQLLDLLDALLRRRQTGWSRLRVLKCASWTVQLRPSLFARPLSLPRVRGYRARCARRLPALSA